MSITSEWALLRARIDRLVGLAVLAPAPNESRVEYTRKALEQATLACGKSIDAFLDRHKDALQPEAADLWRTEQVLHGFVGKGFANFTNEARIVILSSFAGQFDAQLSDPERDWVAAVERSFLHLQRSFRVDRVLQARWVEAFDAGDEPQLESLGAVHLLQHGLFAFKAHAEGARTDLVVGEQVSRRTEDARKRSAAPLVLTEWKKVKSPSDARSKLDEALVQLRLYQVGAAASLELTSTCFALLVSRNELGVLPESEVVRPGVSARVVNLCVEPESPSKAARRRK
ncbi:MAG: hypothetical protein GQE15_18285 [Archangiaceae bacterium]|nr:hypothetical protein [Archangiaceae bacterium]